MFKNIKLKLNPAAHVVLLIIVLVVIGVFVYQTWAQNAETRAAVPQNQQEDSLKDKGAKDSSQNGSKLAEAASPAGVEQGEEQQTEDESQGQIAQIIAELQQNVTSLAGKVEPYYNEIKSLLLGSEEKIADLNQKVDKLEERIAHLELLHSLSFKIFEATPSTESSNFPRDIPEWKFKETTVEVEIKEGDRAIISSSSDGSGDYVHDNDLYVNGTNLGPGFSGFNGPSGAPAEVAWRPVSPKDVTPYIPLGKTNVTFELRDKGAWYGNTEIYLTIFRDK